MPKPIFLLVSPDSAVTGALAADLGRRFGVDYGIVPADGPAEALAVADGLQTAGVALVVVDQSLGLEALDLMARVRTRFRNAKRVLLVDRGDWSPDHPAVAALAAGQIDFHLYRPWAPLERILYPSVSEFLSTWEVGEEPVAVALSIVDVPASARSHEIRDVLTRVNVPYWFHASDSADGRRLLADAGVSGERLPVIVYHDGTVLEDPSHAQLMRLLGVRTAPSADHYDVAVVGAGPAGLAASVYAASEGLRTVVFESVVPGGQAGTSSLIRNYLGFQRGVSGADLANRATEQAWLFGAEFVLDQTAAGLARSGADRVVRTASGATVAARAVVIATGVAWRRLGVPALEALVGAGVFYGAASAEARAMAGRSVFIVGAGNSAGQAALHLARYAKRVTMLVRGTGLAATMSEYLITEISTTANISVRVGTSVLDGGGPGYLESLTLSTGQTVPADALFLLIGAHPHTEWLADAVTREERGYLLTGRDVAGRPEWPLQRPPSLLETTMPGVFAAGDVRHRSVKRVASAVGEGATAIQLVHEYLSETT